MTKIQKTTDFTKKNVNLNLIETTSPFTTLFWSSVAGVMGMTK